MNCTNDANTAGPSAPMDQSRFLNRFDATKPLSARARRGQIRYPSRQPLRPTIARRSGSRRNGFGKDVPSPGGYFTLVVRLFLQFQDRKRDANQGLGDLAIERQS